MSGRSCTAGHTDKFATVNAVEWGVCECGEGSADGEVPLFDRGDALACVGCCQDAEDA